MTPREQHSQQTPSPSDRGHSVYPFASRRPPERVSMGGLGENPSVCKRAYDTVFFQTVLQSATQWNCYILGPVYFNLL